MTNKTVKVITDSMLDKKAQDVVSLDLRKIESSITDWFIVCSANSTTQVAAIADNVLVKMKEKLNLDVLRMQGLENDFWVILDFGDAVVHIFLTQYREFYRLEDLWADAPRKVYTDEPAAEKKADEPKPAKRVKPKSVAKVRASVKKLHSEE